MTVVAQRLAAVTEHRQVVSRGTAAAGGGHRAHNSDQGLREARMFYGRLCGDHHLSLQAPRHAGDELGGWCSAAISVGQRHSLTTALPDCGFTADSDALDTENGSDGIDDVG